ncbi:hypothetical protein SDC9_120620 [bioreactor metagenome]|uniref:Uncharacterized protein n=1 Tax=bioreactor metagenome TaxID=1076179 RepID=A0A645C819_9ZZZZ
MNAVLEHAADIAALAPVDLVHFSVPYFVRPVGIGKGLTSVREDDVLCFVCELSGDHRIVDRRNQDRHVKFLVKIVCLLDFKRHLVFIGNEDVPSLIAGAVGEVNKGASELDQHLVEFDHIFVCKASRRMLCGAGPAACHELALDALVPDGAHYLLEGFSGEARPVLPASAELVRTEILIGR